jgi:hypothetical protein
MGKPAFEALLLGGAISRIVLEQGSESHLYGVTSGESAPAAAKAAAEAVRVCRPFLRPVLPSPKSGKGETASKPGGTKRALREVLEAFV